MYKSSNTAVAEPVERKSSGQKAVERFTEMMIGRMEAMKASDWKKGWIDGEIYGLPQNISGRCYSGTNSLFLQMHAAMNGFSTPVYMTFLQIQKEGARVNSGAEAMPVAYWDFIIQDKDGRRVKSADYRRLSKEEQKGMTVIPFMKAYNVFNIDQTNLREVSPEKYAALQEQFRSPELRDKSGMYVNEALDRLFERQEWLCPIQTDKHSAKAYYSPSRDRIVLPMKEQFRISTTPDGIYKDGMEFYSSAVHEMAHSTGAPGRLNRTKGDKFGDEKYAKEELVAELTAANVGYALGFDSRILDNNAAYLDSWIEVLKENPKFIVSVMADVNKASAMVLGNIDRQRIALGQEPLLDSDREKDGKHTVTYPVEPVKAAEPMTERVDAAIIRKKDGGYAIRASFQGTALGMKPVDSETGKRYFQLPDGNERLELLAKELNAKFGKEVISRGMQDGRGMKMG